jgi:hypothetical protein
MDYKKICEDLGWQRLPKHVVSPSALSNALLLPESGSLVSNIKKLQDLHGSLSNLIEALGAVDATFAPRRLIAQSDEACEEDPNEFSEEGEGGEAGEGAVQETSHQRSLGKMFPYLALAVFRTRTSTLLSIAFT